ncbi:MAG: hypothetical protein A2046_03410 [Bacteroidetes bacterium GWA2_30_7]|nr:MAG: hypothetical protein A2046_03410 [Bacteroidetes bacterium GWA2_30_7]
MLLRFFVLNLIILSSILCYSQIGGNNVYEFLNLPNSARAASLGGNNISLNDNDLNFVYHNPSLLDSTMNNHLVLNYVNYFSDINYGYVAYAHHLKKYGTVAAGLHHINYGKFIEADETGVISGNFYASDYALNLYWSKPLDSAFTFGAELKPIYSKYESYTSWGLALDAGITYHSVKRKIAVAFVINNLGRQMKPYRPDNREPLPFEMQLGISKKIKHAPLRISLLLHNLETYNLRYVNTNEVTQNTDPISGDSITEKKFNIISDNLLRHTILGVEFLPFKNFFINFGYNYQRRKELQVSTRTALVGMSWGIGVKISKFNFSYGRASYHLAGASNHFSITTNISDFYKKKTVEN